MSNTRMISVNSTVRTTVYKDVSHIDRSIALDKAKAVIIADGSSMLRVTPTWHNTKCTITMGLNVIPEDVVEWKSFRALVRKNLVTIIDQRLTDQIKSGRSDKSKVAATSTKNKKSPAELLKAYDPKVTDGQ